MGWRKPQLVTPPPAVLRRYNRGVVHQVARAGDFSQSPGKLGERDANRGELGAQFISQGPRPFVGYGVGADWSGCLIGGQARVPAGKEGPKCTIEHGYGKCPEGDVPCGSTWRDVWAVATQDVAGSAEKAIERREGFAQQSLSRVQIHH